MAVDVKSEKLHELVDAKAQVEQLATGFTFTEGPIWDQEGRYLLFSDMPGDIRRRWSADGRRHRGGAPEQQGQRDDLRRRRPLLVCEHVDERSCAIAPDGERARCSPRTTRARS